MQVSHQVLKYRIHKTYNEKRNGQYNSINYQFEQIWLVRNFKLSTTEVNQIQLAHQHI